MNQPVQYAESNRPGCLIQIIYFLFIGWWLGGAWVIVAWVLMVTIIGLPLGVAMLNNVPQVMALRGRRILQVSPSGYVQPAPEVNIVLRVIYFLLIGWWLSLAYALCMSILGLPLGFWMFDLAPAVVSLKRV
ncbi:MAG: YccF domain-containing protein [Candidatus Roseilinea sp.]|uniref:YccF domain-containing protein n=1 Tax=Candidatus Roseilinea sp. TaxID=2838777 RepID=UPI00404B3FBA